MHRFKQRERGVFHLGLILCGVVVILAASCSEEQTNDPPRQWPDGMFPPDGALLLDGRATDLGAKPDGLVVNVEGPKINILSPTEGQIVVGNVLNVKAEIKDEDGVEAQSVTVTIQGESPVSMSISTQDTFEALVEISEFTDKVRLWIEATDLLDNTNTEIREFERDPGPMIQFLSPAPDSRHTGSVTVQVEVADEVIIKDNVRVRLGSYELKLKKSALSGANHFLYTSDVKFDDPVFGIPLSGKQVLIAEASNTNGAESQVQQNFYVDNEGPTIAINSQTAGQLIGGIIDLQATIDDPAGVLLSSVKCVIGNNLNTRQVNLLPTGLGSTVYTGQFDTRTLDSADVWPVMSFRATDKLGNESHNDIEVGLDNGPPIIELDPPYGTELPELSFFYFKEDSSCASDHVKCSHPFDPVGPLSPNDGELVSQLTYIRVRIEDQGNAPATKFWLPISAVNKSKVWLYALDDTSKALVVDSTGDGYCDSINPDVVPIGSSPLPGQAVAVRLSPILVGGAADFTLYDGPFPSSACEPGIEAKPPKPLCDGVLMTVAIYTTVNKGEPAIYSIPPIVPGDSLRCTGIPFDFKANSFQNGWVCVAVEAPDNLGNYGVSKPIRVWLDLSAPYNGGSPPPSAGSPPNCTGTLNKATGIVSATPCVFRPANDDFPQVYPMSELIEAP
ncbi:MAG: hypothetical protein V1754_04845 [Pseudomonadota bacterium]